MLLSLNRSSVHVNQNSNSPINTILFIVILCVSIPSVLINIFVLYRLNSCTKLSVFTFRTILYVSLFTTCISVPLFSLELYFPLSSSICKLWLIFDYASIVCLGLLVCWASVQRHILLFGPSRLKKLQSTLKLKFIPSILAIGLPIVWYSILVSTCTYDRTLPKTFQCRPCFENEKFLFLIDTILSLILPLLITIMATFSLVVRIICLRFTVLRLPLKRWRRCKRLTHQMILFSFIYFIGLAPYVLTNLNSLYHFWPSINATWCLQIADAFTYIPCCFSSFLSMYAFPEIWASKKTHRHKTNRERQRTTTITDT